MAEKTNVEMIEEHRAEIDEIDRQIVALINERGRAGRATVVSTNLNPEQLRSRYGERIVSRLTDRANALILAFRGDDLRRVDGGRRATV